MQRRLLAFNLKSFTDKHLLEISDWKKLRDSRVHCDSVVLNFLKNVEQVYPLPYFPETRKVFVKNCDNSVRTILNFSTFPNVYSFYILNKNFTIEEYIVKTFGSRVYSSTLSTNKVDYLTRRELESLLKDYDLITRV